MSEVTVTVTGRPGSGKSTISQIIRDALKKEGVVVRDNGEVLSSELLDTRCRSLRVQGTVVQIEEQVRRS